MHAYGAKYTSLIDGRWISTYTTAPLRRIHQEIKAMANKKGTQDRYSYENTPLLDIDLDHVSLDELHLLLRIMDVHLETCQEVNDIWELFHELYTIITKINSSNTPFDQYFEMARKWVIKCTSLREKRLGYTWAAIAPYIHEMVYHVPIFLQKFNSVKPFTEQGVEKNNDSARNVVLRKSNKKDAAADVLKLKSRQWQL